MEASVDELKEVGAIAMYDNHGNSTNAITSELMNTNNNKNPIRYRYSINTLLEISKLPNSKKKPGCVDHLSLSSSGCWKNSETPYDERDRVNVNYNRHPNTIDMSNHNLNSNKRRQIGGVGDRNTNNINDPRDRLKKENDNLILSPQRRSFNMGCHMPSAPNMNSNPPINRIDRIDREINNRGRIGSGRILNRDVSWDYKPEKEATDAEYSFRPGGGLMGLRDRDRDSKDREFIRDEKYDRRSFSREIERNENKDNILHPHNNRIRNVNRYSSNQYSNNNYNDHHSHHRNIRRYSDREEEPEWFSGGPTSQQDTIELRGFDDPIKDELAISSSTSISKTTIKDHSHADLEMELSKTSLSQTSNRSSTPSKKINNSNEAKSEGNLCLEKSKSSYQNEKHFNFEEFLKLDTITVLLPNDDEQQNKETRSSRFSQWFQRESPSSSLLHDELSNMINENPESPSVSSQYKIQGGLGLENHSKAEINTGQNQVNQIGSSDSNKYFSPISPANTTNNLMELFRRNNLTNDQNSNNHNDNTMQHNFSNVNTSGSGKIQSVEELEARILYGGNIRPGINSHFNNNSSGNMTPQKSMHTKNNSSQQQNEMIAFKKLLSQMSDKNPQFGSAASSNINLPHQVQYHAAGQQNKHVNSSSNILSNNELMVPNNSIPGGDVNLLQMLNKHQQQDESKKNLQMFNNIQNQSHSFSNIQTGVTNSLLRQQSSQQPRFNQTDLFQKNLHSGQQQSHQSQLIDSRTMDGLKRPDIQQSIVDGSNWGDGSHQYLVQQLSNPAVNNRTKEAILSVFNTVSTSHGVHSPVIMNPNAQPQSSTTTGNQKNSSTLQQIGIQLQKQKTQQNVTNTQQQQSGIDIVQPSQHLVFPPQIPNTTQKTMRLSPLPNGISQRIPSPRELQYHTQSIMQNALIKKKLEEQRENFRKRQEAPGDSSCVNPINQNQPSPIKQHNISSPTPLAFTPTSVLRKMTAEKDDHNLSALTSIMNMENNQQSLLNGVAGSNVLNKISSINMNLPKQSQQHSAVMQHTSQRMGNNNVGLNSNTLGIHQQQQGNSMFNNNTSLKWNSQLPLQSTKPIGRPILKGGTQMQYAANIDFQQQFKQQQQQQRNSNQKQSNVRFSVPINQQHLNGGTVGSSNTAVQQQLPQQIQHSNNQQQSTAASSQQLQQLFHHRQQQIRQQQHLALRASQFSFYNQQQQLAAANQQNQQQTLGGNATKNMRGNSDSDCIINYNRDGGLSPTSNQLARWFSPELLAKAQAGKLPSLNIGQALSLEEFERSIQHSSATVHN